MVWPLRSTWTAPAVSLPAFRAHLSPLAFAPRRASPWGIHWASRPRLFLRRALPEYVADHHGAGGDTDPCLQRRSDIKALAEPGPRGGDRVRPSTPFSSS
jgi:hypothetical protein